MTNAEWNLKITELSEPFEPMFLEWRAGATTRTKDKAQALPYADPRAYEERLDKVFGADWEVKFITWGESRLICELTVHGITRSSTGEFDTTKRNAIAEGTVAEAQAFKRACSKFGLGRYLYEIPIVWVPYDSERGKLLEFPTLPSKFLPTPPDTTPILKPEKVESLRKALIDFGFHAKNHKKLCETVLGESKALGLLTENEGRRVYEYALDESKG
jgi:hypothetical protein